MSSDASELIRVLIHRERGGATKTATYDNNCRWFFCITQILELMYYVYILYSKNFDRYYVGQTNDVERRLIEHNENPRMTYTHKLRPWVLVAQYEVETRSHAMKLEKYIKRMKSRKIVERLVIDSMYFDDLAQMV